MVCNNDFRITKERCERIIFLSKNIQIPRYMREKNVSGNALSGDVIWNLFQGNYFIIQEKKRNIQTLKYL